MSSLQVGLINSAGKYLTAEAFGNKLNASASSLRFKQVWLFDQETGAGDAAPIGTLRSGKGLYLEADKAGTVSCQSETKTDDANFEVVFAADGGVAFKGRHGLFLCGNEDQVDCTNLKLTASAVWRLRLYMHPQINLKSVGRKRFVRTYEDELRADLDVPWGAEAVVLLMFVNGNYVFQASTGKYFSNDGFLCDGIEDALSLILEIHSATCFAFKTTDGRYVSPQGPNGQLALSKKVLTRKPGKDELFTVQDSEAQCTLKATNGKFISVKQGVDVKANQLEAEVSETFQIEMAADGKASFYSHNNRYWSLQPTGLVTSEADDRSSAALFTVEWQAGKLALSTDNGRPMSLRTGGQLIAGTESDWLAFHLVNRPLIALRCDFGFVGITKMGKAECNRGGYDLFRLLPEQEGVGYRIGTSDGQFWQLHKDGSVILTATGDVFNLHLVKRSRLAISSLDGRFMTGQQNGDFKASSESVGRNTLWEY